MICFLPLWLDNYLYIPVEGIEESEQPVRRKALQPAVHKCGYLWLVYSQYCCCHCLAEFALSDYIAYAGSDLCLSKSLFGIRDSKISKHIAA